jgi:hypothetical protein
MVTIYEAGGLAAFAGVVAVLQRPRLDREWVTFTSMPLIVLVVLVTLDGWHIRIGPPDLIDIVGLALVALFLWVVYSRTGSMLAAPILSPGRYRQYKFDKALWASVRDLHGPSSTRTAGSTPSSWTASDVAVRLHAVDELHGLEPPTPAWGEVRDRLASLIANEAATMPNDPSPSEIEAFREESASIAKRIDELRNGYRTKPRTLP